MELNLEEIRARLEAAKRSGRWAIRVDEKSVTTAQATLIAKAPSDIGNLVAEVERLRMALEQSQREQFKLPAGICPHCGSVGYHSIGCPSA